MWPHRDDTRVADHERLEGQKAGAPLHPVFDPVLVGVLEPVLEPVLETVLAPLLDFDFDLLLVDLSFPSLPPPLLLFFFLATK